MNVKLLTEQYLEFLSLTGGCTGSSESTLVKIPHCWKSHVTAHLSDPERYFIIDCKLLFRGKQGDPLDKRGRQLRYM